ncbi:MAG: hypothetical protein B7Z75_09340 [Acidocella sp. 20-57-95]|nr:MAG: hypothetical protein B7Z75_09340 [Acidocella sp. 20-57-95]OYV61702.1 MAG: hypothetical protein B7Z71_04230 [Acidocella sp. 21-58-7]HQT65121.1 hypothetical protein [Acidocella sp.]
MIDNSNKSTVQDVALLCGQALEPGMHTGALAELLAGIDEPLTGFTAEDMVEPMAEEVASLHRQATGREWPHVTAEEVKAVLVAA